MELLVATSVTLVLGARTLLAEVDLTLRSGERIGLIGRNGAGKSTLLALLAGSRRPDDGAVRRAPGIRLSHSDQPLGDGSRSIADMVGAALAPVREIEAALRAEERRLAAGEERLDAYGRLLEAFETAGGYRADADARSALAALGLPPASWERPSGSLSGGELRRLQLALALARRPDVLLLDEPTNHLDLPMRRALGERLARLPGAVLVASHDRALLDRICTHTATLEGGHLTLQGGGYSDALQRRERTRAQSDRRRRAQAREEAKIAETVAQLRRIGSLQAQRRRKRFERRLQQVRSNPEPESAAAPRASSGALPLGASRAPGPLLRADRLRRALPDGARVAAEALAVAAGDRVALVGSNGSGKSTLLRLLAGDEASDDSLARLRYAEGARVHHAGQSDRGLPDGTPVLAALGAWVDDGRARQLLAEAGLPPERWRADPADLSGGERARAALALIAASEANLLLLDEPGNDLDLAGIELLESTLLAGGGGLVIVSHDQRLIERLATRIWSIEGGEVVEYRGGFAGYLAGARRLDPEVDVAPLPKAIDEGSPVSDASLDRGDRDEAGLTALEEERHAVETALLDPLALSERQRGRLTCRRTDLIDALSLRYGAELPPPPLRFSASEGGVRVRAERVNDAGASLDRLDLATPLPIDVRVRWSGEVAHLSVEKRSDLCTLPWALAGALAASARLCHYLLPLRTVQVQSNLDLTDAGFTRAGHGWWLLSRRALERREGWLRDPAPPG
jgi:ATP-binding cassette subfamily F protein 3